MKSHLTLRLKLLLPSIVIVAAPLLGWWAVNRGADALQSQATHHLETALSSVVNALSQQPALLGSLATRVVDETEVARQLYSTRINQPPELDGRADEWLSLPAQFGEAQLVQINFPYHQDSLTFTLQLASDDTHFYLLLRVADDRVVYREISHLSVHRNDHLRLALIDPKGAFQRYTFATEQPGELNARVVTTGGRALREEPRISGYWRATEAGYNLELGIPKHLMQDRLALNVADVDDQDSRDILYLMGNSFTDSPAELGLIVEESERLKAYLASFDLGDFQLVDSRGRIVAQTTPVTPAGPLTIEATAPVVLANATVGTLTLRQQAPHAAHWKAGILKQLLNWSALLVTAVLVLAYLLASRVTGRLSQLQQEVESAVDAQGRVKNPPSASFAGDEIGDLSRSFSGMTRRLQHYNEYLENLSGRLAHELRTPISVVRSSLENLSTEQLSEANLRYIERAHTGLHRLSSILNSMSEATRLEQSLDQEDLETFDLCPLVQGCFEGYEAAYDGQHFSLRMEAEHLPVTGIPDLLAQMLDKLVSNAVDFSDPEHPVILRLTEEAEEAVLRIANEGPNLPVTMNGRLFEPMVSVRQGTERRTRSEGGDESSHLGLGLYVAKIITEFHGGTLQVNNREDTPGVIVTVRLPKMRLTSRLST